MTDKQFCFCVAETANYTDRDAYVSDLALSSIWADSEDAPVPESRIAVLAGIWDASRRTVKQIAVASGLSCRKLAERFCIPYRTMEDWAAGRRESPLYVRLMMQEALAILAR